MIKLSFRQQVFIGFGFSIFLVLFVGLFSYKSIKQLQENQAEMEYSQKLINTSDHILQLLVDAETGMRGFVATGKPVFLDPYNAALPRLNDDLSKIKDLESTDPAQSADISSLAALVYKQLDLLKSNVDNRDKIGLDEMVKRGMLLNGKQVM